jgi:hypothetical protein
MMPSPLRRRWGRHVFDIGDESARNLPIDVLLYTINSHSMTADKTVVLIHDIATLTTYIVIFAEVGQASPFVFVMYFDDQRELLGHLSLTPRLFKLRSVVSTIDRTKPKAPAISTLLICVTPKARLACK